LLRRRKDFSSYLQLPPIKVREGVDGMGWAVTLDFVPLWGVGALVVCVGWEGGRAE
jgi:hypothetical protein